MKIVYKIQRLFFLILFSNACTYLLSMNYADAYDFGSIGSPIATNNESSNLDSQSSQSIDFNNEPIALMDFTPIRKVQNILSEGVKKLKDDDFVSLKAEYDRMDNIPDDAKEIVATNVANLMLDSLMQSPTKDPRLLKKSSSSSNPKVQENNDKLDVLRNSSSNKKKRPRIDNMTDVLTMAGPRVKQKFEVVDLDHIVRPNIKKNELQQIKQVLGGHDLYGYELDKLRTTCFIAPDKKTIGIYVDGKFPKTVQIDFNESCILDKVTKSDRIAKRGELEVRQVSDKEFIGLFISAKNNLIVTTAFPIIVVQDPRLNRSNDEVIGSFGTIFAENNKIIIDESVIIDQLSFDDMIRQGVRYESFQGVNKQITDITIPAMNYIRPYLDARGLTQFFHVFALTM